MLNNSARFITKFGVVWLVFMFFPTGWVVLKQLETRSYVAIVSTVSSYVYLGKVFYSFKSDLLKKVENRNFNLVGSWPRLIFDIVILVVLMGISMRNLTLHDGSLEYIVQYNNYGYLFLTFIFLIFRFTFQLLQTFNDDLSGT